MSKSDKYTPRDQLADVITRTENLTDEEGSWALPEKCSEAILAAGWRPPARVVTTVEELDALAVGSIIMEGDHGTPDDTGWGFKTMPGVFHRFPEGWHVVAGIGERAPALPATVIYEPKEGSE